MSGDRDDCAVVRITDDSASEEHGSICSMLKRWATNFRLSDYEEGDRVDKKLSFSSCDDLSTALNSTSGVFTAASSCSPEQRLGQYSSPELLPEHSPVSRSSSFSSTSSTSSPFPDLPYYSSSSESVSEAVCQSMAISPPVELVVSTDRWNWARDDFRDIDKIEMLQTYLWNPPRRRKKKAAKKSVSNDSFASTQYETSDRELND